MSQAQMNITACLHEDYIQLSDAAAIAKAAVACAEAGSEHQALQIIMDLDTRLHEATTLHGAVYLIGRMARAQERRKTPDD
ncbi:hypothetical protein [Methylobacterium sp. P5_C11]